VSARRDVVALVAVAALLPAAPVRADDWPEWRGADRLAVWSETGIVERLPADGLRHSWRVPIGSGYAGPAVAGGRVFVLDWHENPESRTLEGTERLLVLDEATGEELWSHRWQTSYRRLMGSYAIGPRATPTVDGDRVYVVGATGHLWCLDVETGAVRWQTDYVADYGLAVPPWGVTSAPLVDGDRLIAIVGGEPDALVVAFDKHTGDERWRALEVVTEAGYGQPVIYEAGGARQLIIWHPTGLTSLDPASGERYWEQPFETTDGITVATPVRDGRYLLVTQLYNGALMMRLDADRAGAELLWKGRSNSYEPDKTDGLHTMTTTPIVVGDHVYGVGAHGELRGLDARTGERLWMSDRMTTQASYATAFFVRHDDRYFVNTDDGDLILARFTPTGYEEIDRVRLIEPTSRPARGHGPDRLVNWVHPAYANGHIVHRNDREIVRASLRASDY
jgi:outer membrane protein assembly factor BamB